jgi:hypothetical protein
MTLLSYSYIETEAPITIPPRSANGGLYTGKEAPADAPWRNIPVIPEAHVMVTENLKSANPPPQSVYMIPGETRPGNNTQQFPNHKKLSDQYQFVCGM